MNDSENPRLIITNVKCYVRRTQGNFVRRKPIFYLKKASIINRKGKLTSFSENMITNEFGVVFLYCGI